MTSSEPPSAPPGPTTLQLLVVAALGLLLGAAGTAWLLRTESTKPPASPRSATKRPEGFLDASPPPLEPASPGATSSGRPLRMPTKDAALEADVRRSAWDASTSHDDATEARAPMALLPGRVAYLRCPGAPLRPGPYPCPRARRLERRIWIALRRTLARCSASRPGIRLDLRIVFDSRGLPPRLSADSRWSRGPQEALLGCLRPALAPLRMPPPYRRLALSMRWTLLDAREAPEDSWPLGTRLGRAPPSP